MEYELTAKCIIKAGFYGSLLRKRKAKKGCTRIVCISDTHSRHRKISKIPPGDVLVHCGDFSTVGRLDELEDFNDWLGTLPHKHKLVIAGNHDLCLDESYRVTSKGGATDKQNLAKKAEAIFTNCTYLRDESVEINGIKFYGSPWQPEFCDWAFNLPRGEACRRVWQGIPDDCDVLLTHGPPLGYGDLTTHEQRVGCEDLLYRVESVKPLLHVFGHIHEDYGVQTNGSSLLANASTCNFRYRVVNPPLVFDVYRDDNTYMVLMPPSKAGESSEPQESTFTSGEQVAAGGGGGGGKK